LLKPNPHIINPTHSRSRNSQQNSIRNFIHGKYNERYCTLDSEEEQFFQKGKKIGKTFLRKGKKIGKTFLRKGKKLGKLF